MNRGEEIPVDGSRSTTGPSGGGTPAALPPGSGRDPGRALPGERLPGRAGVNRTTSNRDGPVRAVPAEAVSAGGPVRPAVRLRPPAPAVPPDRPPARRDEPEPPARWGGQSPEKRTAGSVTRRSGRRRGALAARRVVGL